MNTDDELARVVQAIDRAAARVGYTETESAEDPHTKPGTFWGDLFRVRRGEEDALHQLAGSRYLSRCAIFHPERWRLLEQYFRERHSEDVSWRKEWLDLCMPNLFIAAKQLDNVPARDVYRTLRLETRKSIEQELLDGETLDQHLGRNVGNFTEDETPEMQQLEAEVVGQIGEEWLRLADVRIDLKRAIAEIDLSEREALLAPLVEIEDRQLAAIDGVKPAAIRKRRQRAKSKLQGLVTE